jgi:all-trans-retinol dehydrogenase (NAD+)
MITKYFHQKTVLITGAASGIGKKMALLMAEHQVTLIILDINAAMAEEVVKAIEAKGSKAHFYQVDLSNLAMVERVTAAIKEKFSSIDILINNAGVVTGKSFRNTSAADIEKTFAVNTIAPMLLTRAVLEAMLSQGHGHIVNIASAASIIGVNKLVDYSASKFAIMGFDESLRMEIRRHKMPIYTTVVCPYFIDTGMFAGVRTRFAFLLPILDENKTARRIVRAIARKRKRHLWPPMVYSIWLIRYLPVSWFDFIADLFGINATMDQFTGRKGQAHGNS